MTHTHATPGARGAGAGRGTGRGAGMSGRGGGRSGDGPPAKRQKRDVVGPLIPLTGPVLVREPVTAEERAEVEK